MKSTIIRTSAIACALLAAVVATAGAQSANSDALFKEATAREQALRRELDAAKSGASAATQRRVRTLVGAFEDLSRLFPSAGQADKALWLGASLSADLYFQAGNEHDRDRALLLVDALSKTFPGGSYARQGALLARRLQGPSRPAASSPPAPAARAASAPPTAAAPARTVETETPAPRVVPRGQTGPETSVAGALLTTIRRENLQDAVRMTLELDREVSYHSERLDGPDRVFVDLSHARAVESLKSAVMAFEEGVVRRARVGVHPGGVTRVVLDLEDAGRHSLYTLYNPYRIVIDVERPRKEPPPPAGASPLSSIDASPAPPATTDASTPPVAGAPQVSAIPAPARATPTATPPAAPSVVQAVAERTASDRAAVAADIVAAAAPAPPLDAPPPAVPAVNARGGFSLSRQLGLGIARVVIDAGHGGHDPGAQVKGLTEAELTLDIALRLEKLLLRQPGVEVILTRRTNTFVPLEERTEIANRSSADVFLSIHANASADRRARGVETYFLNFAPSAEAEAIAARENAASTRPMRQLPELVRAIALNNKLDESRDLARLVQSSLFTQARRSDRRARDLGVKQAPFMVLVGAQMPSVLTEISFLTNAQDAALLGTERYRQQIAEALLAGITRYQQSLKKAPAVATQ